MAVDLSTPSFAAAYAIARPLAQRGDAPAATRRLCELLWHVEGEDGGFIGLSDEQLREKCESDKRLNYAAATDAMHAPPPWPAAQGDIPGLVR
jgi:hypothetical protein